MRRSVYRPPDSPVSIFDTFIHSLELIDISQYSNFILVGEFNVDISNHCHTLYRKISTLMELFSLSQVVIGHTRKTSSGRCSLIDFVFTSNPSVLHSCSVIPPLANSDHLGVLSIFNLHSPCPSKPRTAHGKSGGIPMQISLKPVS